MIASVAAVGDAADINCWSGIPFHFAQACAAVGSPVTPWRPDLQRHVNRRRWWNLRRLATGHGLGGYQYSEAFLAELEAQILSAQWRGRVLTFNPHFPRGAEVRARGGSVVHYIDATFASYSLTGSAAKLPTAVIRAARRLERENYAYSERVVAMSRWAARSLVEDCGVPAAKVAVILPGANLNLPDGYGFPAPVGRAGVDRPLRLGFVGKDWRRKGLPFLLAVRTELERLGVPTVIRCAGTCPPELSGRAGIEYVGFIDKAHEPARFVEFLSACDFGCLFSEHEPLGISTLEFLRAAVPVVGFMVEGVVDTVPPDAGFRFAATDPAEAVAGKVCDALRADPELRGLRAAARRYSPLVTWTRCLREWRELLTTGRIDQPVQLWRETVKA